MYTVHDKMILRQYESAASPAAIFCKFFQDNRNASPYLLFMIRFTIAESSADTFVMYDDVSSKNRTKDLRKRGEKTILVKSSTAVVDEATANEYSYVIEMKKCVEEYRSLHVTDFSRRMGIEERTLSDGLALPALINPMFGPMLLIVNSGLMSQSQYNRAKRTLLSKMTDILDRLHPIINVEIGVESSDSEMEGKYEGSSNANYQLAEKELNLLEQFKRRKFRPQFDEKNSQVLSQELEVEDSKSGLTKTKTFEIVVGLVKTREEDLPSGKNLADYIDNLGRFENLKLFLHHKVYFPVVWIQSQCEESRRVAEVGCERFFNLAGYVSSPKRTGLGVKTYERLAMLSCLLCKVYVDEEWVAQEYLRRCKAGAWKGKQDEESLKCWNLERIIEAELIGAPVPIDLTMEEFANVDTSIQVVE